MSNKELVCLNIDKEKILISTFIGKNRNLQIHEWHQKIFNYFNLPINYIYIPDTTPYLLPALLLERPGPLLPQGRRPRLRLGFLSLQLLQQLPAFPLRDAVLWREV